MQDLTDENLNTTFISFVKSKLDGKARETLPDLAKGIYDIKIGLKSKLKSDNSKIIAGKLVVLQVRNNNISKFSKQAERSLIVEGITIPKAHEIAVE